MSKLLFDLNILNGNEMKGLDYTVKYCYVMLAKLQLENNNKTVVATTNQLASEIGLSKSTFKRCKDQLKSVMAFWNMHELIDDKLSKVKITAYNIDKDIDQNKIVDNRYCKILKIPKTEGKNTIKQGYVYFLKNGNNQIKIGLTTNISRRFNSHTDTPELYDIIHVVKSKDMRKAERLFHEYFKDKRITGEWFDLNNNDIDFIKSNHYPIEISEILI